MEINVTVNGDLIPASKMEVVVPLMPDSDQNQPENEITLAQASPVTDSTSSTLRPGTAITVN